MLKRLFVVGLLLVYGQGAGAAILVTLNQVTNFDWVYDIRLQPQSFMSQGDAFTVYDFPALQSATFIPDAGVADRTFALGMAGTGFTPPLVAPTDDPQLDNVTVTLTGGDQIVPSSLGDAVTLGQLVLTGVSATPGEPINFTGLSAQQAGGTALSNIGFVPAPVPEPSTIGFMGVGLLAVAGLALRRRKRAA